MWILKIISERNRKFVNRSVVCWVVQHQKCRGQFQNLSGALQLGIQGLLQAKKGNNDSYRNLWSVPFSKVPLLFAFATFEILRGDRRNLPSDSSFFALLLPSNPKWHLNETTRNRRAWAHKVTYPNAKEVHVLRYVGHGLAQLQRSTV